MESETITITVQKTVLSTLDDAVALLEWTRTLPGIGCMVTATVSGDISVQLDGLETPTAYAVLGDTVAWDGTRFTVTRPDPGGS